MKSNKMKSPQSKSSGEREAKAGARRRSTPMRATVLAVPRIPAVVAVCHPSSRHFLLRAWRRHTVCAAGWRRPTTQVLPLQVEKAGAAQSTCFVDTAKRGLLRAFLGTDTDLKCEHVCAAFSPLNRAVSVVKHAKQEKLAMTGAMISSRRSTVVRV